ncbi:MAG TPA: hypothetical protein VJ283_13910 [Trebonia sp.]|jgi:hypothetical protein|nr:hypothetical protein [Trebonia sp.]
MYSPTPASASDAGGGGQRYPEDYEVIVYSAYDFENFVQPRPEIPEQGLKQLRETLGWLVQHRWPFRLHATYDETVS